MKVRAKKKPSCFCKCIAQMKKMFNPQKLLKNWKMNCANNIREGQLLKLLSLIHLI